MSCATLTVFDISMATTQLGSGERSERVWPLSQPKHSQQRYPIMNWVVVTDDNGIGGYDCSGAWPTAISEGAKKGATVRRRMRRPHSFSGDLR